jgi:hypothetical protein
MSKIKNGKKLYLWGTKMSKIKEGLKFFLIIIGTGLFIMNIDLYLLLTYRNIKIENNADPKIIATSLILISIWWIVSSIQHVVKQLVKEDEEKVEIENN